jgi:hypothetical protein
MSETNDFAKRLFLDFLAARLRDKGIEKTQAHQTGQGSNAAPARTPGLGTNPAQGSSNRDLASRDTPPTKHARHPRAGLGTSS